jgi:hypothetical protein
MHREVIFTLCGKPENTSHTQKKYLNWSLEAVKYFHRLTLGEMLPQKAWQSRLTGFEDTTCLA